MSIFGNILNKIFRHDTAKAAPTQGSAPVAPPPAAIAPAPAPAPSAVPGATTDAAARPNDVDVGAVLQAMASMKNDHGNYQTSIVDLLKLLDLDSGLSARKELGEELGVHAGVDGSAEQNIALHRAVMDQLVANGGVVPDSLRQ